MTHSFDSHKYAYPSTRRVVFGTGGMVCTTQPLAAQAGRDIIAAGGNAIDAAIATAACMTVLEPTSNGIGSDAFALVWTQGKLHGLNSSGFAPALADAESVRREYGEKMPSHGWIPVTVPGAPSAWAELSARFGKLPLEKVLEPAASLAERGFPVQPITAQSWQRAHRGYLNTLKDDVFAEWFRVFAPNGKAPGPGEVFRLAEHAATIREIAATKAESFYRGALAEKIAAHSKKTGGWLREDDLAAFRAEWVEPVTTDYRGYTVHEIPPNGHGIVALMALNIMEGFDLDCRDSALTFHRQIEAMKLAFTDGKRYIADPAAMKVTFEQLLSKEYAAVRRALITDKAIEPQPGNPARGGTIYLCTADGEGNMVSYIQSNYMGFGSGLVVPGTGISLHNRGNNFSLNADSENCLAPRKKPYHTIIPGFLSKDGDAVGPFGVMGGFMQPQGHMQVVMNTVDFHMNPQEALDAPRWQWIQGREITVERAFPYAATEELVRMGHQIKVMPESGSFGRGQIIWRDSSGVLSGATEPRADGFVAVL